MRHLFTTFVRSKAASSIGVWALALALIASEAAAQKAVVLSGGGARGIAHAGVVRGLDSLGVDPDFVVGTSMGAVIGALYASGLDGPAVWDVVVDANWQEIFNPHSIIDGPTFGARLPLLRVELGEARNRSRKGILAEWRVNRTLVHELLDAGVRARGDFDQLPRRYRAVTADLNTGEAVVLSRGDLPKAVRASMAIPGAFAVVAHEGRTLIDGGVANYLPVDVAKSMGADWVVASDVVLPVDSLSLATPLTIGSRGFNWLSVNARNVRDTADVSLYPALDPSVTTASFLSDVEAIARQGYEAALTVEDSLTGGESRPPGGAQAPKAALDAPARFSAIEVRVGEGQTRRPEPLEGVGQLPGDERALGAVVQRSLAGAMDTYDPKRMLAALDKLYATGLFDGIWPAVSSSGANAMDPVLRVDVDPVSRSALLGGFGYELDRGPRVWAALRHRGALGDAPVVMKASGLLGELERYGSVSADIHPAGWTPMSLVLEGHLSEVVARAARPDLSSDDVLRLGGNVGVAYRGLSPDWVLRAMVTGEYLESTPVSGNLWGPTLRLEALAPLGHTFGVPARLDVRGRFGVLRHWRVRARGSRGTALGPVRVEAVADATYATAGAPPDAHPALGDDHGLPGVAWGEGRGKSAVIGGLDLGLGLPLNGVLRVRLRGAYLEGFQRYATQDMDAYGAEVGGVWKTPFGAFELRVGANTLDEWRVDLGVGSLWQ
ncbi:MAG: patatin-like phospholipase family protein [Longimicrobiales bacterium]